MRDNESVPTSVSDPMDDRVADFRDLKRADRRPDRPGGRGLVIAEGAVAVRRLFESPYPVRAVLGVEQRVDELADVTAGTATYTASPQVMADIVGFHLNRGVLAVADKAPQPTVAELAADARLIAVTEGVGDHENLGALFRNAAALGVDGVIVGPRCSDPLYRRSVRVSMGHVLRVPFATADDLPASVRTLHDHGFTVAALTPAEDAADLRKYRPSKPIAVLLGAEGPGLSDEALNLADEKVRIPMPLGVDSLNVATAAAIAFYELRADGSEPVE